MYNFPGVALNKVPEIGDTIVWDGEKWVAREADYYFNQSTWWVDPINGNDVNDGATKETALRTNKELNRRVQFADWDHDVTITYTSDVPKTSEFGALALRGTISGNTTLIIVKGEAPINLTSVVLTGVTNIVVGTTRPSIQVAGFDFTPYLGTNIRLRCTDSATANHVDAICWIDGLVGGDPTQVYINSPYNTTNRTLSVGDTIAIESLINPGRISCDIGFCGEHGTSVICQGKDLAFTGQAVRWSTRGTGSWSGTGGQIQTARLSGCYIEEGVVGDIFQTIACRIGDDLGTASHLTPYVKAVCVATSFLGQVEFDCGRTRLLSNCNFVGRITVGGREESPSSIETFNAISIWDWGANQPAIRVAGQCYAWLQNPVWGTSVNPGTYGLGLATCSQCQFTAGALSSVSGTAGFDVNVGGSMQLWAAVAGGFINPANNTAILQIVDA